MGMFAVIRGILVAIVFVGWWFWMAASVRQFDPANGVVPPEWLIIPGWVFVLAGGVLAASCVAVFGTRGKGTPAPFDPPRVFVATGPYRYVRNPMYAGGLAFLAGLALFEGSVSILIFAAILFAAAHLLVILYEEPVLKARFGESYAAYLRSVPRWLPRRP